MPRRPRIHYPGAVYHAIARGVEKRQIFMDSDDFSRYTDLQSRALARFGARRLAYCLMPNHTHLAIKIGSIPLSRIMHKILFPYASTFNEKYDRVGHLFQGRYTAYLVTGEAHLMNLVRYIHQNPVRAKLVAKSRDWKWSSCTDDPREEETLPEDFDLTFGQELDEQSELLREISVDRPSLDSLGSIIHSKTSVALGELRSGIKRSAVIAAKTEFATMAAASGYTASETARWLGVSNTAVSNYLRSR